MSEEQNKPVEGEAPEGPASSEAAEAPEAPVGSSSEDGVVDASAAAEEALEAAETAARSMGEGEGSGGGEALNLPEFDEAGGERVSEGINLLSDVNVNVRIELGRTDMLVEDVLRLGEGSVVELDKLAGDPVDIFVNNRPVARGEVLVLNDNFCVRVNEILAPVAKGAAEGRRKDG